MKKYSVIVKGTNVYLNRGQIERMGFFANRWFEATSKQEAEELAIKDVRRELIAREILFNSPEDPPVLTVEKTQEVDSFGDNIVPGKGFTFYEDKQVPM